MSTEHKPGQPLSSYDIPHADPSLGSQKAGAMTVGYLLARNSLPDTFDDLQLTRHILSDERLSDSLGEGAAIGSDDKKKGI